MSASAIRVEGLAKVFGGLTAVDNVSLEVPPGERRVLIGPNGAGKTTLVNVVSGVHRASEGRVRFDGEDVTRLRPFQAARRGIARTFQIVQPFPAMTVLENVTAAALFAGGEGSIAQARSQAREHLEFVGLAAVAGRPAAQLTLAMRKRLELAKSLAMQPKLLLLDEVNAGLNSVEMDAALALIRGIAARGIAIVLLSHDLDRLMSLFADDCVFDASGGADFCGTRFTGRAEVRVDPQMTPWATGDTWLRCRKGSRSPRTWTRPPGSSPVARPRSGRPDRHRTSRRPPR